MSEQYRDSLNELQFYKWAMELWDLFWQEDSEILMGDLRGREICKQLTRSLYSISANIEEGSGRGYGKEYPQYLRISRASAKESRGGYYRARFLLNEEIVSKRMELCSKIIGAETKAINKLIQNK